MIFRSHAEEDRWFSLVRDGLRDRQGTSVSRDIEIADRIIEEMRTRQSQPGGTPK